MCPHTTICVPILLYVSSNCYLCVLVQLTQNTFKRVLEYVKSDLESVENDLE
jgi:hypothetical protein